MLRKYSTRKFVHDDRLIRNYRYFKPTKPSSGSQLPEPDSQLSMTVPLTSIIAVNQEASKATL